MPHKPVSQDTASPVLRIFPPLGVVLGQKLLLQDKSFPMLRWKSMQCMSERLYSYEVITRAYKRREGMQLHYQYT